jgi:hypothetical protein
MRDRRIVGSNVPYAPEGTAGSAGSEAAAGPRPKADRPASATTDGLGRIVAVSGSQVVCLLDNSVEAGAAGQGTSLQVGALIKMKTPGSTVFGMVSGLSIPIPNQDRTDQEMRIVELDLVGEAITEPDGSPGPFQRGVSFLPSLGDGVLMATQEDLRKVYAQPTVASVQVGTIYQDKSLPAFVAIDDMLGKHMAVLGTTGTGKSCAVALLLRAMLTDHACGHIVLLDLHNEYARSFENCAEVLGPGSIELPYWLLNFEEICQIVVGSDRTDREMDSAILKEAILSARQKYSEGSEMAAFLTADTPVPYRLSDVNQRIEEALGKLDKSTNSAPFLRLKDRLGALTSDKRYEFLFPGLSVRDNMAAILSRIFRIPVEGKPVTILDLSGVPSEILNVVISLLCRLTFDFAMWSERELPILLVCEEAQRYMGQNPMLGFESTKRALTRIAKEGRKYGVSLCLVSQRPSDLAAEILSQCNTIFAMRMSNQKDQDFVRATLSESAIGLMDSLPTLRTGEAIAVGEGVSVPVRLRFDLLPDDIRPHGGTTSFSEAWRNDEKDQAFVKGIVDRWRRQRR